MKQNKKVKEKTPHSTAMVHSDPLLNRVYQNRGVESPDELSYGLGNLLPPWSMKDIDLATNKIVEHIHKGSHILIVGDYDCDGATSTTIAIEGLYLCGARSVSFVVPDRVMHGYGISVPLVEDIKALKVVDRIPDLIITVDNGISAFDGAEAVHELLPNSELLITDHHLADAKGLLPKACAIVNPNRIDCDFPSKNIAGCGVIFYVIMALRNKMESNKDFLALGISKPDLRPLLDVLALGTVADVVTLDYNNRIIISSGISRINKGLVRPGIRALLEVGGRKLGEIVASDMGFAVGPRINAAGRMSDMSIGINCLLAKTYDEAIEIARSLDYLNKQRREVEQTMVAEANINPEFDDSKFGVTILGEDWHEGVVGIVSARIKEKLNRPVICFTNTEPHNGKAAVKGSARSVKGIHLKHILVEIHSINPNIMIKFGGHAMAAGLSIYADKYQEFARLFDERVKEHITQDILDGLTEVDIEDMPESFINIDKARLLEASGPWGQHFEEPLFAAEFDIVSDKPLQDKHLRLELQKGKVKVTGIWFNCIDENYVNDPYVGRVKVIFSLAVNRFNGRENVQIMVKHLESLAQEVVPTSENHQANLPSLSRRKREIDDACLSVDTGSIIHQVLNRQ